jgi:amino acid adenylation domain-containing protein/thioester reductase-like protein
MSFVTKENTQDIYALSPTQKGMLFHSVLEPDAPVYFEQFSFTIAGSLDEGVFRKSWGHLIASTPVFRTVFRWSKLKDPLQIVLKDVPLDMSLIDLSGMDQSDQYLKIDEYMLKERSSPFKLEEWPLMRLTLFRLGSDRHHFLWSHHHILIDGWCMPLVLKDLFDTYMALMTGQAPPRPLRRAYKDYISWLSDQDQDKARNFWKGMLNGFETPNILPYDYRRGEIDETGSSAVRLSLPFDISEKLKELARKERITMSTLLQAAWAIMLRCYSAQDDVVYGTTVSGRPADLKGSEDIIGLFINTLPVRVKFEGQSTLSGICRQIQDIAVGMREFEYSLLPDVKAASGIPRDQNLFDSIFVFENVPVDAVSGMGNDGLGISNVKGFEMTNFPITIIAAPGEILNIDIHYHRALFSSLTVSRMKDHMLQILKAMAESLRLKVADLDILSPEEREQILFTFNKTESKWLEDKCPYNLFEEQVLKTPDRQALWFEGKSMSYSELNARSNQLANFLRKRGLKTEGKVCLLMERSLEMIISILAIHKAGGCYVPMDPEYPKARLEYMLEDSGSGLLLTQEHLAARLSRLPADVVLIDRYSDEISGEDTQNPAPLATPSNLSHIIYTSGSTGLPKGVMIEHSNVTAFLCWCQEEFRYEEYEEMIASTSMCFDLSVFEFFLPLVTGAKVIILKSSLDLDDYLSGHTATMINTVPSAIRYLCSITQKRHRVRAVNLAGEPLKLDLVKDVYNSLDVDIVRNLYGPTEDTTYSTNFRVPKDSDRQPLIGRPLSNGQAYVLDKNLKPVPVGVKGEIYLSGAGLARGYFNAPEKTAQRFIPHPFSSRWKYIYKTGDLGSWLPDGNLDFHGRVDYQVKIRGNRIEMGEIEARLALHEMIRDVVVADRDDSEGNKYLVCYYVSENEIPVADLRAFIQERLPEYMVPSRFIKMEELPLTPNGKVDRKALPDPGDVGLPVSSEYVPPAGEVEETIAQVWMEVLGVGRIGRHDNFFDLGGHSLLVMKALAKLKFTYDLTMQDFFDCQTIAEISARLYERGSREKPAGLELKEELPEKLKIDVVVTGAKEAPKRFVLTGATGYLGAHLLYEMLARTQADICCLVRAGSVDEGYSRILEASEFYFGKNAIDRSRVIPVCGDISKDGLSVDVNGRDALLIADTVIHAASDVRHYGNYRHFRNVNVLGIKRLLGLLDRSALKRFHYISTLSVAGDAIPGFSKAVFKETDYSRAQILDNVYAKSKFEAEGIVRDARVEGLDATIYRVGNLVGSTDGGKFQKNISENAFYGLIKAIAEMKMLPEGINAKFDMTPVDSCRRALASLMLMPETSNRCLHVFNPNMVGLEEIAAGLIREGLDIKTVPASGFLEGIKDKEEASELMMLHFAGGSTPKTFFIYDDSYSEYFLNRAGFSWQKIDADVMHGILGYCISTGFITPSKTL